MATKEQNASNARRMKEQGIVRKTLACSICHRVVAIFGYEGHLLSCKGR
jgi:hypothetical protein